MGQCRDVKLIMRLALRKNLNNLRDRIEKANIACFHFNNVIVPVEKIFGVTLDKNCEYVDCPTFTIELKSGKTLKAIYSYGAIDHDNLDLTHYRDNLGFKNTKEALLAMARNDFYYYKKKYNI